MPNMTLQSDLRSVRVEAGTPPDSVHAKTDMEPLRPPYVHREFNITTTREVAAFR